VDDDKQYIRFAVKDTGIGIEPSQQGLIFQKFQQEDTSTTRKYGGTGLGLSISKQLVEIMGGELKLVSEKEVGTEFSFKLLLPSAFAPELEEQVEKNLENVRVLLVEDNEINRFLAVTIMRQWNAIVEVATDGIEALEKLKEAEFDIVLMDLQMPRMGGYEASEAIRNQLKLNMPIIALTANALTNEYDKCLDCGMNDYVSKPFQPDFLFQKMSDCLAIHKISQQSDSLKRA
jgi:CheY-like chemotaxis protein